MSGAASNFAHTTHFAPSCVVRVDSGLVGKSCKNLTRKMDFVSVECEMMSSDGTSQTKQLKETSQEAYGFYEPTARLSCFIVRALTTMVSTAHQNKPSTTSSTCLAVCPCSLPLWATWSPWLDSVLCLSPSVCQYSASLDVNERFLGVFAFDVTARAHLPVSIFQACMHAVCAKRANECISNTLHDVILKRE